MKVCVYVEWESQVSKSGIGTSARQQRKALRKNGVEVTDDPSDDYDVLDVNTVGPKSLYHLKKAQTNGKPAVVHAHTTAKDFRDSFRGSNLLAPALRRYLSFFYSRADAVIVPSDYTKGVVEGYGIDPPVHSVSNGVDIESLEGHDELRDEYRDKYDLDGTVVFAVGHVFERKGLSTFCKLAQRLPDTDFIWFGPVMDNPLGSKQTKRWIENPPDNVEFTGFIDDIRGGFGAGDVFLFPTKEENQGIAVLEAMACEKGVVVSDLPVFDEFLTDAENCFKGDSLDEYEEAIERMRDDELRNEMGKNARREAEKHSLENVGESLIDVYDSLL
ncbi:MAG: glycosyltransferase [Halobacteria archaeon]|nr:glycosyltransferase [Halobacteria archaeon]